MYENGYRLSAMHHTAQEALSKVPLLGQSTAFHSVLCGYHIDAAFALMISENLFTGDREQNEIHQRAYKAILNGEPMTGIQFRYDYDLEDYLRKHMWD